MKRETFVSLVSTLLSEADDELLREAEGLCFWRRRELRAERVKLFMAGQQIEYLTKDGRKRVRPIDHLNKYSVSVKVPRDGGGWTVEVIPIERVIGSATDTFTALDHGVRL